MAESSRARKVTALSFLFAAFMFSFMIRAALSVAAPTLMKEYEISPAVMGNILAGWNWTYTGALLVAGVVVDKVGPWLAMGSGSLVWGFSTVALPLAGGAASLFVLRMVFGLGQGILVPSIATSISRIFNVKERASAVAVAFSGNNVGTALATTVSAFILAHYGWPAIFYVLGGGSLLMTLLWFLFFPEKRVGRDAPSRSETPAQKISWASLFRFRSTWGIAFGQFGYLYAYFFFIAWLPAYFIIGRNMTLLRTGIYAALPFWAGMLGTLLGGWLSDYLVRRGHSRTWSRKSIIGAGLCGFTGFTIAAAYSEPVWLCVTMLILAIGLLRLATGPCNSLPIDLAPRSAVGSLTSIQNLFGNVGGLLAPIVGGYLLQTTGSFTASLMVAAGMALVGAISFVFVVGDLEKNRIGEPQTASISPQVSPSGAA